MLKGSDTIDVTRYCLAQVDLPSSPPIYEFDFYALLDLASHKRVSLVSHSVLCVKLKGSEAKWANPKLSTGNCAYSPKIE